MSAAVSKKKISRSKSTSKKLKSSKVKKGAAFLSIIIVNYNVKEFLEQLLSSVQRALKGISAEIIVVDNASSDGSQLLIREKFPSVKLIENAQNAGFAKASNQGLETAQGDYLALINPDTIVQEDTFTNMLNFFEQYPETGMLGCKILNPDGSLQLACRRSFPTPWISFTKLSGLSALFPKSKLFGKYNLTYLDPEDSYEVEAISGSFMMIQRKALKDVGALDEDFFLYGEDLDWCYRFREAGWRVQYFPGTQIVHFKGESSKRAEFDNLRTFYQSMGLFVRKHFKRRYLFMPYWLLWVAIWSRAGVAFLSKMMASLIFPVTDFLLLTLSLTLGVFFRFGHFNYFNSFVPVIIGYSVLCMIFLNLFRCYDRNRFSVSRAGFAVLAGFVLSTSLTFFLQQFAFSRAVVLLGSVFCLTTIAGWRLVIKLLSQKGLIPFTGTLGKTLLGRKTLIVGDVESGQRLIKKLNANIENGYDITGLVSTNGHHTGEVVSGVKILGELSELNSFIEQKNIQEVIFSTHQLSYDQILGIISRSGKQRVNFKLIPSNLDVIIGKASIDKIDDVPLLEIDYRLHQNRHRLIKRIFDLILVLFISIFAMPFYLYKRYVLSIQLIEKQIYGADSETIRLHEFKSDQPSIFNHIPLVWSILKGELSFVGCEIREVNNPDIRIKSEFEFELKPGLTGLVQINSKRQLTEEDKTKYHLYYLKNYSPLLDLEILFKAIFKL